MGFFGVLVREWEARKASQELHIDKKTFKKLCSMRKSQVKKTDARLCNL